MEMYLYKSAACLAVLFLFYKLVLENTSAHTFKRFYLLIAIGLSFAIPLLTFTTYIEASEVTPILFTSDNPVVLAAEITATTNYLPIILWSIYGLGALFFSLKFFRNLYQIIFRIQTNPKEKSNATTKVLLTEEVTPHTFFNFIFLNRKKYKSRAIPPEVLLHEQVHATQKHSIDVLLIEFIQILFWFNPMVFWTKRCIKLNHEFLADRAVLKDGIPASTYQNLLLAFSSNASSPQLANSINYSSFKKRFTVMKTQTSRRGLLLRASILLPLLALLIFSFSSKEIVQKQNATFETANNHQKATSEQIEKYNKMAAFWNDHFLKTYPDRIMPISEISKLESIYRIMTAEQKASAIPFPECTPANNSAQEKANSKQVSEYNALAKKYNAMSKDNMMVGKNDVGRLKYLYNLMSSEQRNNAEPFPSLPPPPPAPDAPKVIKGVNDNNPNIPPPPPPAPDAPKSPLDHVISMAKKGAAFYFDDKKISSDKAIDLIKKNKDLNIEISEVNSDAPYVKISTAPITIKKNKPFKMSIFDMPLYAPQPNLDDPLSILNLMIENGAKVYFEGEEISKEKAREILNNEETIERVNIDTPHDIPAVILGNTNSC